MICPDCHKHNVIGAIKCAYCGSYSKGCLRLFSHPFWSGLLLVIITIFINWSVETIIQSSNEEKEHRRLLGLLKQDFQRKYKRLQEIDRYVMREGGLFINNGKYNGGPMEIPIPTLQFHKWQYVELNGGSFWEKLSSENLANINEYYSQLEHIEVSIQDRIRAELVYGNRGTFDFAKRILLKDNNIHVAIKTLDTKIIDEMGLYYYGERIWQSKKEKWGSLLWQEEFPYYIDYKNHVDSQMKN